jgi:hypothetical protein
MSTARFHPARLSLYLLFAALLISETAGPEQATISIIIDPPQTTLHVGQTQSFMALVGGRCQPGNRGGSSRSGWGQHNERGCLHSP